MERSVLQTTREKTKLLNRVRRIRGQVGAIERALEKEIGCADVLQLITAARGAVDGKLRVTSGGLEPTLRRQVDPRQRTPAGGEGGFRLGPIPDELGQGAKGR
jgi:DNA-binding FrmR family transcriptional regulator